MLPLTSPTGLEAVHDLMGQVVNKNCLTSYYSFSHLLVRYTFISRFF